MEDTGQTKEAIKEVIREIHSGADPVKVKERFKSTLGQVDVTDIGRAEQELVAEGMPRNEIKRLCDVHLAVMGDALRGGEVEVPPGHPVHTFREEHKRILQFLDALEKAVSEIKENPTKETIDERLPLLNSVSEHLMEVEGHNTREENVLFPYLEKRGITEPPAVMWSEHDELRKMKKRLHEVLEAYGRVSPEEFAAGLSEVSANIVRTLSGHIFKENNILYPMALEVIKDDEWADIRNQCDELGYCCLTPETAKRGVKEDEGREQADQHALGEQAPEDVAEKITFPTGSLTHEELEWTLNTLPVEITFVDRDDTFRYFSGTKDRVFARARASIGRKVQNCHPAKSLHVVNGILDDFRNKRKDREDFWLHLGDKYLMISYHAVRNAAGEYLGTLETIQDIGPIQEIKGDKRIR